MSEMVEQPHTYFSQWVPHRSDLLKAMEAEAENLEIPIVGPVMGRLLYLLARLARPRLVLEVGTANGYSAIFLAEACCQFGGRVVTFEKDAALAAQARANIAKAGLGDHVEVRCVDALVEIKSFGRTADMIFLDIEKQDYAGVLPQCKHILSDNGLLFADNTGFKDAHRFNQALFDDPDWESVNLWSYLPGHSPENDGLCMALKRPI